MHAHFDHICSDKVVTRNLTILANFRTNFHEVSSHYLFWKTEEHWFYKRIVLKRPPDKIMSWHFKLRAELSLKVFRTSEKSKWPRSEYCLEHRKTNIGFPYGIKELVLETGSGYRSIYISNTFNDETIPKTKNTSGAYEVEELYQRSWNWKKN